MLVMGQGRDFGDVLDSGLTLTLILMELTVIYYYCLYILWVLQCVAVTCMAEVCPLHRIIEG